MTVSAVQPICLPDPDQDYSRKAALVSGWGLDKYKGEYHNILQKTKVYTTKCRNARFKWPEIYDNQISDNMICAFAPGTDACQGDSGGPLAVRGPDGSYSQIGIVSFGFECAKNLPGLYTRVAAFLPWIEEKISGKNQLKLRL